MFNNLITYISSGIVQQGTLLNQISALTLTFDNIANAAIMIGGDAADVNDWNTFFGFDSDPTLYTDTLILWLISFIIFWGYATWYIAYHGIPLSWSDTYYRLKEIYGKRNIGYIMTGVLWGLTLPMIPIVVENHPFMFLALVLIAFIGAAPAFNDRRLEYIVHMVGSIGSVITAIIALALVYHLYLIAGILALIVFLLYTKTVKIKNSIMWIESIVIFSGHIVILFKDVL